MTSHWLTLKATMPGFQDAPTTHLEGQQISCPTNILLYIANTLQDILPLNRFLATAVWDNSWRLWDLEQLTEVTTSEQSFNETLVRCCIKKATARRSTLLLFKTTEPLPALEVNLLTILHLLNSIPLEGLDSFGRVWDLRTGQCIMFLEGHLKGITGISFAFILLCT